MKKAQLLIDRPHTRAVVVTRAPKRAGRPAALFAVLGIVIALVAGGLYLQRQANAAQLPPPEPAVTAFLTAVFDAGTPPAVAPTVCAGWSPEDALARTRAEVGPGTVSWDGIGVVTSTQDRAIAKARVHSGGGTTQWRFNLVAEAGQWRVCEARPFTT